MGKVKKRKEYKKYALLIHIILYVYLKKLRVMTKSVILQCTPASYIVS